MALLSSSQLEALPRELALYLTRFLTGYDLLPLSHVNKRFYADLLADSSDAWTTRMPCMTMRDEPFKWRELDLFGWREFYSVRGCYPGRQSDKQMQRKRDYYTTLALHHATRKNELEANAKRHYFASVSLQFAGCPVDGTVPGRCTHGAVISNGFELRCSWPHTSFSFDVWFALLPSAAPTPFSAGASIVGGVLLGTQSCYWTRSEIPAAMAQFVHVDPHGHLYCSVVANDKKRVLTTLQLERWYHLALTFDKPMADGRDGLQSVYLDGALIDTRHGALPANFGQYEHYQIGTGFMDAASVGNLRPEYQGVYSFHGLVDDFRFWRGVLTPDDVQAIRAGRAATVRDRHICDLSLMDDNRSFPFCGVLTAVRATRPSETVCVNVQQAFGIEGAYDPSFPY